MYMIGYGIAVAKRETVFGVTFDWEIMHLKDGGNLALDWASDNNSFDEILIIFPGITGTCKDIYIISTIKKLESKGLKCVIANHWGAPGTKLSTPWLYSMGSSEDIGEVFEYMFSKYPFANISALGFSLGANLLTKYLGESKESWLK